MECEFAPFKLTCYERLMVIDMFFESLTAGDKDGPLPGGQRRYGRAYARMRYDDITLGHGTAQLNSRQAHYRVDVQSRGISVSYLPEHISAVRNYLDKLFQQASETEALMHSQRYDDAARRLGMRYGKRAEPIKDRNLISPSLIGPALVLRAELNRTKRCEQTAGKRGPVGPSGTFDIITLRPCQRSERQDGECDACPSAYNRIEMVGT